MTGLLATPVTPDLLRGAVDTTAGERGTVLHRLPPAARERMPDTAFALVERQPAGVRIEFRSRATVVELELFRRRLGYTGVPLRPDGIVEILVDGVPRGEAATGGGALSMIDPATGATTSESDAACTIRFDGLPDAEKGVALWLPHNEEVELVELRTDAPVLPAPAGDRPRWLFHGSSLVQGSNATHPSRTWAAVTARARGLDLTNLGFGGNAMLDPFVARAMAGIEADVIGVEIGINLVNADAMRMRALVPAVHGFLDAVRDGHPSTPLLVVSPLHCEIHEQTPGPGAFDPDALREGRVRFLATGDPREAAGGRLTLRAIRSALGTVVEQRRRDDPHLHLVDGLDLYGAADEAARPLPDGLHPDAAAHELIGERMAAALARLGVGGHR